MSNHCVLDTFLNQRKITPLGISFPDKETNNEQVNKQNNIISNSGKCYEENTAGEWDLGTLFRLHHVSVLFQTPWKPELQSHKALPQTKKLLSSRTMLCVFISQVQGSCSCHLVPLKETLYIQECKCQDIKYTRFHHYFFGSMIFSITINTTNYFLLLQNLHVFS